MSDTTKPAKANQPDKGTGIDWAKEKMPPGVEFVALALPMSDVEVMCEWAARVYAAKVADQVDGLDEWVIDAPQWNGGYLLRKEVIALLTTTQDGKEG